jgi:hypothetical protein
MADDQNNGDGTGDGSGGGYRVGYRKPPREYRFPPGQSGNPGGRKKGARGLKTDLQAELDGTISISINGEPIRGTRQRLFVKALATRAAFGDLKAAAILAPLILQVLGAEDRGGAKQRLSPGDQAILDDLLGAAGEPAPPAGPEPAPDAVPAERPSQGDDQSDDEDGDDNGD